MRLVCASDKNLGVAVIYLGGYLKVMSEHLESASVYVYVKPDERIKWVSANIKVIYDKFRRLIPLQLYKYVDNQIQKNIYKVQEFYAISKIHKSL